jgi:LysR family cyn operon transcriptional activator
MDATAAFSSERLRAFVAVAREGGFSRAARALGQSQSGVSQAVAALERSLGERLFVRDGRTTHLTDAGRVVLEHAERALREMTAARAALDALRDLTTGRLAVGTSDTLATYVLPPVFAALRKKHPGVELRLDNRPSPTIAARVAERALDLGVVSLPLPADLELGGRSAADELRIEPIAEQRDVLVCPRGHALSKRSHVSASDLAAYPLLLLDRSTATRAFLDAFFAERRVAPRVVMEMNGVEVLKRLVELDFGVSIVPEHAAAQEAARGTLAVVRIRGLPVRRVGLLTPTAGPLSRAARAFIELARRIG